MRLKIEDWMQRRNLNRVQVAEALGIGVPSVNVWIVGKVRAGERTVVWPSPEMLDALCRLFECEIGELLEVEATATPSGKTWRDFDAPSRRGRPRKTSEVTP